MGFIIEILKGKFKFAVQFLLQNIEEVFGLRLQDKRLIMTEKDAVKLRNQVNGDAWYVPLDVALPEALVGRSVALATGAAGAG